MRPLAVVVGQPGVQVRLQGLHALEQLLVHGGPEELLQHRAVTVPLNRSTNPLVRGVPTLVRRCSMSLSAR